MLADTKEPTMHSVAVYLVQRLCGGPEECGWY